jgi:hypothetical protein
MSTTVALQDPEEVPEPLTSNLLDERQPQQWEVEHLPEGRGRFAVRKAVKWASIIGLLVLGGLWSRVTPFEVAARFIVDAGAIIVMAQALFAKRYTVVAVSLVLVLLYNPLAPLFNLSGDWQRGVLVAGATPFLALLIWRDMRTQGALV